MVLNSAGLCWIRVLACAAGSTSGHSRVPVLAGTLLTPGTRTRSEPVVDPALLRPAFPVRRPRRGRLRVGLRELLLYRDMWRERAERCDVRRYRTRKAIV